MVAKQKCSQQLISSVFALTCLFLVAPAVHGQTNNGNQPETRRQELERTDALKEEIQFYIRMLDSGNPYIDDWARQNLVQLGSAAVPSLINALENYKARKRFLLCEILGRIRDPQAVPALLDHLSDMEANPSVASAAARALGQLGDRRAVDPLLDALDSSDRELVYNAIEALGNLRAKKAVDRLLSKVDSDKTTFYQLRIGNAATSALGKIRTRKPAVLKKFKSVLTSDASSQKEQATGLPKSFYVVRALEQIALQTKGPIMVSDTEKSKETKQNTIDAWVKWINNELGIEQESNENGNGEQNNNNGSGNGNGE